MSILKRGLKGAPVKRLQISMNVEADGDFGPGTEKAVKEFQQANGLAVDGIAGPDTFMAAGLPELVLLRVGSRGDTVKKMQADLSIEADGKFGAGTKAAVVEFQKANGLTADGMAGPTTLSKMNSFASTFSEEVMKKAEVQEDEAEFDGEDLPEINGAEAVKGSAGEAAPEKSVWGKIKGWFS